ncbi:MAG: cytochrome C oxidase subunit IV family protein [Elusimicrobia bacterium]|nr:cytochrome C oxidase subunit IV family protein [Elusimicrobiota bacterium]
MKGHSQADVKLYLAIFGALMVLTVVTVLVSYLHLPIAAGVAVGMAIATLKAGLVAAFFMHLKGERIVIYGLLGVTIFFMSFLFLAPIKDSVSIADRRARIAVSVASEESPSETRIR